MMSRERLPEQHSDGPHVRGRARLLSVEALRRDVRERSGHVADGRERVRVGHQGQAEIEEPDGDAFLLGEQHVRGLHVAVHDPACVRERQALKHLCRSLDRALVTELMRAERLPERRSGHVFVRDVEMLLVGLEPVRAQAVRVAQRRRRFGLSFGARRRPSLSGDDLERKLLTGRLVANEPHRARAAAPERAQGAIPVQDETVRGDGFDGARRHRRLPWPCRAKLLHRPDEAVQ